MPVFKNKTTKYVTIGIGVVALSPLLIRVAGPLARSALKGSILIYERGREKIAEFTEIIDDLKAEVRQELQHTKTSDSETVVETLDKE